MRTPKIEALGITIQWINEYIIKNQNSQIPKIQYILSKIYPLKLKSIDNSSLNSNPWLTGFTDADGNFSINIHHRSNRNSTRVQLYYRLEIRQTYHRLENETNKASYFTILNNIAMFLNVNLLSRSRIIKDKQFNSFIIIAHNKNSINIIYEYFKNILYFHLNI